MHPEQRPLPVLFRQYGLSFRDSPVYAELRVVPGYGPFRFRSIVIVTLVLKHGLFRQHTEPVRKTARDEKLPVVPLIEPHGDMPAEGRRAPPDVHGHIQHGPFHGPDEFGLAERRLLEMQSPHHTVDGPAFVVLHKDSPADFLRELPH